MSGGFAKTSAATRPALAGRWLRSGTMIALGTIAIGLYLLVFRPMTREVAALEADLERTHRQIVETGFGYPETPGRYLEAGEAKLERMRRLAGELTGRFAFHDGVGELLAASFRVLEFEQRRFDIRQSLTRLAEARGAGLPADLFAGLPSYHTTTERQQELWLHLEFFNHVMEALLSSGRDLQVEQVGSLPVRTLGEGGRDPEGSLLEIRLRLQVRGPVASLAGFLNQALPGSGDAGGLEKKAYSIERLDLQRATEDGQVRLDAVLSGFIFNDQNF